MKMYSVHQTYKRTSASQLVRKNVTRRPVLPLGWVIPDGTNRTLEENKGQEDIK